MDRFEKEAYRALAKRLRSMVPDEDEFVELSSEGERQIAAAYFEGISRRTAESFEKKAGR